MPVFTRVESVPRTIPNVPPSSVFRPTQRILIALLTLSLWGCRTPKDDAPLETGSVVGRILDVSTETPVAGVRVADGVLRAGLSDSTGAFSLILPTGLAHLTITANGYRDISLAVKIVHARRVLVTIDGYIRLAPVASE